MRRRPSALSTICLLVAADLGCGSDEGAVGITPDAALTDGGAPTDAGDAGLRGPGDAATGTGTDAAFAASDAASTSLPDGGCSSGLLLTVRDFTETHPDFQHYTAAVHGIVADTLGADNKPVYAPSGATAATTSAADFDQWYRDVAGVNMAIPVSLTFMETLPGVFVYDSSAFFPIDGEGLGNGPVTGINVPILGSLGGAPQHNFLFTSEAHTRFTYRGGETFTFRGDDDLWVFIHGKLAVDLGGTHTAQTQTIMLDALTQSHALTVGQTYDMDIFHAERHTDESNYRIETTIDLSCIENVVVR